MLPTLAGSNSTEIPQLLPCATDPADGDEGPSMGHGPLFPMKPVKPVEILGFDPDTGGGRASGALPMFETIACSGSSVVSVESTGVGVAKVNVELLISTLRTRLFLVSAT